MCGISGLVNCGDGEALARMTQAQAHRGPDDSGVWERKFPDGSYIGLGSRRLAILDLSQTGHMPMCNEDRTVWITYNGEVYNFVELRRELEGKGHRFVSHTDTEVILHLYEQEGPDCVKRLNGMFAFAICDLRSGTPTLFVARNTTFVTPFIDLLPYQPTSSFAFISLQTLFVNQSVSIFGSESPLFFIAGNTIAFAPNTFLSADAPEVFVAALGTGFSGIPTADGILTPGSGTELSLVDASISNSRDGGTLSIFAPSISLLRGGFASEGNLNVTTQGDLLVEDGVANVLNGTGNGKSLVQLFARHDLDVQVEGNITLQKAAVFGVNATMNAKKNFTATAVTFGADFQGNKFVPDSTAQTVSLQARRRTY